jgi:hypothetical protein
MSVSVSYGATVTVQEVLEANPNSASAAQRTVTHSLFNSTKSLNGSSTPPVTKVAAFKAALSAGAKTLDLTALIGTNGVAVDGTGLKVQVLKVKNLGANTLAITPGASNGYGLLGSDMKIVLAQNQEALIFGNDLTPDVASGAKNLDLAGTLVQESEWIIILG